MKIYPLNKHEKMVVHLLLCILVIIWIIPLVSAIEKSFYANGFQNYIYVFSQKIGNIRIHTTFVNSFIIAIAKTLLLVIIAALAGYGFARTSFHSKKCCILALRPVLPYL